MRERPGVRPVPPATHRSLRIYALDPLEAGNQENCITTRVPFEPLRPGPIGARIEVIDRDPAAGCFYSPVDLDHPHVLAQDGLAPSESDPRFHQQMVYAVAMTTLGQFEHALGRPVRWGGARPRLRIYPHGTAEANAFFSPELGALVFGYFRANRRDAGRNLPGGYVFTCLSHDVVAHETSHALVHSLRGTFMEPTNVDSLGLHEAFADLVAILQHVSLPGVVENAVQLTRASLDEVGPLVSVGRQMGEAIGMRGSLRCSIGEAPDPGRLDRITEPHERGAVLVSAVFAAFLDVYRRRTRDLLRIATGGTGVLPPGHVAPDLVHRLAAEARKVARHYLTILIRALDYCPPVDCDFGELLRAAVTADRDVEPEDPVGYRAALIEAFRSRGIVPRRVFSLAEDSIVWDGVDGRPDRRGPRLDGLWDRDSVAGRMSRADRAAVGEFVRRPRNLRLFRLDPSVPVEVRSIQPLTRIGPDRRIHHEVVIEVLQTRPPLADLAGAPPYRGGATIIMDAGGRVRYVVYKPLGDRTRRARQEAYLHDLAATSGAGAYRPAPVAPSLAGIHRGLAG